MSTVMRLRAHELHEALAGADVPRAAVDELLWREVAENTNTLCQRPVGGWRLVENLGDDQALLFGDRSHTGLILPTAGLTAIKAAALTAAAAQMFVEPQVVTVAVVGDGLAARLQIATLAAHVPGVSHIAVYGLKQVPAALVERLDAAGIGLTVTDNARDAVFGANLVVLAGQQDEGKWTLPSGTVIVNATGQAVPLEVPVDQVFVDDRRLLASFLPDVADLGQVLAGTHPGRTDSDDVVLIDLLNIETGGLWLTHQLYQSALRQGLGVPADALPGVGLTQ